MSPSNSRHVRVEGYKINHREGRRKCGGGSRRRRSMVVVIFLQISGGGEETSRCQTTTTQRNTLRWPQPTNTFNHRPNGTTGSCLMPGVTSHPSTTSPRAHGKFRNVCVRTYVRTYSSTCSNSYWRTTRVVPVLVHTSSLAS